MANFNAFVADIYARRISGSVRDELCNLRFALITERASERLVILRALVVHGGLDSINRGRINRSLLQDRVSERQH
jgi:hypothetical protein